MKDIVERLREGVHELDMETMLNPLLDEAADEIEKLRRQADIAWAAGLFEGEGSISGSQKYKSEVNADGTRRKSGFRWALGLNSTDHDVLRRFGKIVGVERFHGPYNDLRGGHYKPQLNWFTSTLEETQSVLTLLMPYFGERRMAKAKLCMEAKYVRRRPNKKSGS